MYDLTALGELLIDFTPAGKSAQGMNLFEQNPGGAPANVLSVLSAQGLRTAFIGKVGADMHGDLLERTLAARGIDTSGLIRDETCFTTLAFVSLNDEGDRSFSFARKPGADTQLRPEELSRSILETTRIFHFGSLSLTDEPARSATVAALRMAKAAGAVVSYDPNYRPPLWKDEGTAAAVMGSVLDLVDVLKVSEEELGLLTGEDDRDRAVQSLFRRGVSCVAVTLGRDGAGAFTRKHGVSMPAIDVPVTDTTGAGDAFWGGFLCKLLEAGRPPADLTEGQLRGAVFFGSVIAALCIQKRGGIPAMPAKDEVERFLAAI
ncbi:MAG: carbohydrate kinase [Spirochaetaceae bacterium]|jgi:fructokinase|nr:carbohydrate kinase [Spirochaetaceae bacterium]